MAIQSARRGEALSFEEVRRAVVDVARRNGAIFACIFGSYGRGTADARSDLDVFFVAPTTKRYIERLGDYFDPLINSLPLGIDVFVYTPEEFERMKDGFFIRRALAEGKVVYERREE